MGDDGRQGQVRENGLGEDEAREPETDGDKVRSGSPGPGRVAQGLRPYRIVVMLILLGVCGLQGFTLYGIRQGHKDYSEALYQIKTMQSQVAGLQGILDAGIAEDLIFLKLLVLNPKLATETAREIAAAVSKHSRRYKRDPDLILAIIKVESNFDPAVVSRMGAIGLMQVMPQWIDVLGIECDLREPDCNVAYGLQIMGAYEQLYSDPDIALTAYNRGPGPVDSALMRGKNPDNGYADKVRAVYDRLQELGSNKSQIHLAIN